MLLLHIPHAATAIPQAALAHYKLSPEALRQEQLKLTDWFTDELFTNGSQDERAIIFPFSRLFVDVERFANDADEPMAARGMGVFYTKTTFNPACKDSKPVCPARPPEATRLATTGS